MKPAPFTYHRPADLDEALEGAALHPYAARGSVEVRPVWSDC